MAKRIAICAAQVPFERGGAESLVESLRAELQRRGHHAEIVSLPFKWYPRDEVIKSCLAWRLVDLTESNGRPIDLVIATKFPSYFVKHPNKVVWLIHQFRQVYDLADDLTPLEFQQLVHRMDNQALGEARRLYTISGNVSQRLKSYNRLDSIPLYPPAVLEGRYHCASYGDYVFTASRLDKLKRLDWLLRAMVHTQTPVRCLIAGSGPERESLEQLAADLQVGDRVEFLGRVDDDRLLKLYAGCLAVYYAPFDEDYGYVTIEAFKSAKPVLTGRDSGGVLEFVQEDVSGLVLPPHDAQRLARQIDLLYERRDLCQAYGEAGRERVQSISWDHVIPQLVGQG